MIKHSLVLAAGGIMALAAGGVVAAEKSGGFDGNRFGRLMSLDRDQDRAVSAAEFDQGQERRFAERDTNKDGVLKADEIVFTRARPGKGDRIERMMKRFDTNADGRLTKDEFDQGQKSSFAKRDKNADGKISADEAPRWFVRRGGANRQGNETLDDVISRGALRFKSMDANADGVVERGEIEAAEAVRRDYQIKREMHRFDANHDGTVTKDEYMMPAKRRFSLLDLDDDGRITAADLPPSIRSEWKASK